MSLEYPCAQLDTDLLIEEVKLRPCLYARDHLRYGDVNYKRNEWEEVTKKLFKNVWPMFSEGEKADKVEMVLKRWKNLRACFTREIKRQKDPNWIYGVAYKRRKYMYYNALSFLKSECDGADEDAAQDIDLPEKTDADNTTVTVDTNIEEINIPAPLPVPKSKAKTNNTSVSTENTKAPSHSDNTAIPSHSDHTKAPSNSDNRKTQSNSDNIQTPSTTNVNEPDSTNFALSLVPMLNMIPIDERVEAQIEILSVLQPYLKKSRDEGRKKRGGKRRRTSTRHTYGKRKENTVCIEIKTEDEEESESEQ